MILYLFYIAIISSLLSGCDKIVLNAYVFFFYWLAENNTWRKWLSVMSNYQFISWTCWLDIVRNICGVLITSQVPMRSKETIAKSPNIFVCCFAFSDRLGKPHIQNYARSIILGIWDLVAGLNPLYPSQTAVGLGEKCMFYLPQTLVSTGLFYTSCLHQAPSLYELCTFWADACDIVAQLVACYSQRE